MKKLTLEHIAPYLPYELQLFTPKQKAIPFLISETPDQVITMGVVSMMGCINGNESKPILRPLSDLNAKKLPLFKNPVNSSPSVIFNNKTIEMCYWKEYQYLLKNHYDIFELIKNGLAIDINTISS